MTITVSQLNEIKKLLDTDKLTFGATEALKLLRAGKATKIWLSMNIKQSMLDDIKHYAKIGNVEIVEMPQSNEELGELCRKPFPISVISTSK